MVAVCESMRNYDQARSTQLAPSFLLVCATACFLLSVFVVLLTLNFCDVFATLTTDHLLLVSICRVMSWLCQGMFMTKQREHELNLEISSARSQLSENR